ncbi:hypothetical protein B0A55_07464 [Friedmanniomyces simplex]|uniref:C2H2-type domain-containing protein n=1 Tax=Friedmanniomyces simplex TaxID=329884 RepID=A0A4U0WXV5_9PEZI|nr:hypothetical protein B0A55_07464 [Friedmanniomyces simplex]
MNYDAGEESLFQEEVIEEIKLRLSPPVVESESFAATSPAEQIELTQDPGSAVLLEHLAPNRQDLIQFHHSHRHRLFRESPLSPLTPMDAALAEQAANAESGQTGAVAIRPKEQSDEGHGRASAVLAAQALQVNADAFTDGIDKTTAAKQAPAQRRVDSAQSTTQSPQPSVQSRLPSRSPLKLDTATSLPDSGDTLIDSPTIGKHVISVPQGNQNTLPIVQPTSPLQELGSMSLQTLRKSDKKRERTSRKLDTTLSPTQTSPASQYNYSARSPTSTISEMTHAVYGSPVQYSAQAAYYADRRRASVATDHPGPYALPASLPSASSTESQGHASSAADGYSTANTTPIDQAVLEGSTPRPVPNLPPPPGMPQNAMMMGGGFECNWEGCTAPPFQTQYLLSSHKNVHSSTRRFFCPEQDCPRSEGKKGFKRKNEMIRHGLVHNSPGYVCPFCPDKEHRYPRPDNLQR